MEGFILGKKHEQIHMYSFKSRNCPTQHPDLVNFENDLLNMIKNASLKPVRCKFQDKLRKDIHSIRESNKAFISTDKTRNLY